MFFFLEHNLPPNRVLPRIYSDLCECGSWMEKCYEFSASAFNFKKVGGSVTEIYVTNMLFSRVQIALSHTHAKACCCYCLFSCHDLFIPNPEETWTLVENFSSLSSAELHKTREFAERFYDDANELAQRGEGGERSFGSPSYTGSNEGISIEAWRCCCCALKTKGVETCVCGMGETFTWKMRMMNKIILHARFSCARFHYTCIAEFS